ncbi:MAG: peptide deformylase [Endomicrobium sp.]|jgi:peptide deformylase|nr:peptide deformylase [Endomicrobium sp.]
MTKLKIKKYGDFVLRRKTEMILEITDDIKKLAYDMLETMYLAPGIGLAAPQVDVSLKLCVIDADPKQKSPIVMINPKIIADENKIVAGEGCLSFPGFYEDIKRFDNIVVKYTDLNEKKCEIKAQGLLAKVVQHELDHLDAKLFIDYLPAWKRKVIEKEIRRKKKIGDW